jgi:hypothetical protein
MRFSFKRAASLFMVGMLVGSVMIGAFAGGAAAETQTLAGDGTDNPTGFNASADDKFQHSISSDGTDFGTDGTETLFMNVSYDGHEYAQVSAPVDSSTSASQTVNLSHDKLTELSGDAGENTTINVTTWGEDAGGNVTTAESNFKVDLEFADTRSVRTVHSTNDSIVQSYESASDDGWFSFSMPTPGPLGTSTLDTTATIDDTIGVNGTQTDIEIYSMDSDTTDALDAAAEKSDTGERMAFLMTSELDDQALRVYDQQAGPKAPGAENVTEGEDTYAIYHGNGHMTIKLGTDRFDSSSSQVDVTINSGEEVDPSTLQEDLGYSIFQAWGLNYASFSSSLGDLVSGIIPGMVGGNGDLFGALPLVGMKRRSAQP